MEGTGVQRDCTEAVRWYRKAAKQGHVPSQVALGLMYARGRGVAQDHVQAYMWLNLGGSRLPSGPLRDQAAAYIGSITKHMTPAQIAEAQRLAREWKPKKE